MQANPSQADGADAGVESPIAKADVPQLLRRVEEHRLSGRTGNALALIHALIAQFPDHLWIRSHAGVLFRSFGDHERAVEQFRRAWELAPKRTVMALRLAGSLRSAGKFGEALALLEGLREKHPDDRSLLLALGKLYFLRGNYPKSRAVLQQAVSQGYLEAVPALATTASKTSDIENVLGIYALALAAPPVSASIYSQLVEYLFSVGLDDQAIDVLRKASIEYPADPLIEKRRLEYLIDVGHLDEALAHIGGAERASAHEDQDRPVNLGRVAEARWDLDEAEACFRDALDRNPRSAAATLGLARLSTLKLRPDTALSYLAQANILRRGGLIAAGKSLNPTQSLLGELVNDLRTDRALATVLSDLLSNGDIPGLTKVSIENPHYTGCALALLVALRTRGRLERRRALTGPPSIPTSICQYWEGTTTPIDVHDLMLSWHICNHDYSHVIFDRRSALDFIRANVPSASAAFRRARGAAGRSDIFRLCFLFARGGVYADADDRCLNALDPHLLGADLVVWQEPFGTLGNNFIAACPRHPVIETAMNQVIESTMRGDSESIWISTGPGAMTRAFGAVIAAGDILLSIRILRRTELRAFCSPSCKVSYKTARHWTLDQYKANAPGVGSKARQ